MTTATATDSTAPAATPAPVDLETIFYKPAEPVTVTPPAEPPSPSPAPEPGPPAASEKTPAASTDEAKTHESPAGTETKEPETKEKGPQAAARRLGRENADLKAELEAIAEENRVLKAKADGTYQEPVKPTPEEIADRAEFKGRETASRAVAEAQFGADAIKTQIYDDASPYKTLVTEKPWLHIRVARHPQPTMEAMRVLQEETFRKTYGDDPAQWVTKLEAELRPKLFDEFKKQTALPPTGTKAPSITEARGSGGTPKERTLEEMFYGKKPAA